jgi:hypothetical protein
MKQFVKKEYEDRKISGGLMFLGDLVWPMYIISYVFWDMV